MKSCETALCGYSINPVQPIFNSMLKSKAKSAGVSVSEFIRGCIIEGGVKERLSKEHGDFIRKLCGMANNLNQLARKANAEGYASVFLPCRTLVIEIDNLVNRIRL